MSLDPLVSVIIPTYNRGKLLPSAINSVLEQSYKNVEIIVVDDGSTDDTKDTLKAYNGKIVMLETEHKGAAHARNVGMKYANGEYIAFLDSDDRYLPKKIELQIRFIEQNQDIVVVCTEFSGQYKNGFFDERHMRNYHDIWLRKNWSLNDVFESKGEFNCSWLDKKIVYYIGHIFRYVLLETLVPSNTILFSKNILERIGFQDENIWSGQDYDFVVRICKNFPVAFLDISTYIIYHHGNQLSNVSRYRGEERELMEIEALSVDKNIVTRYAKSDVDYYSENRDFVDKRLLEINYLLAEKWILCGQGKKSRECIEQYQEEGKINAKLKMYYALSYAPKFITRIIFKAKYKFTKWKLILNKKMFKLSVVEQFKQFIKKSE